MRILTKKSLNAIRQLHYSAGYHVGIQIGLAVALAIMTTVLLMQAIRMRYANHQQ